MRQKKESQWSNRDLLEVKCVVDEQVGEFHCRLCGEDHPYPYDKNSLMFGSSVNILKKSRMRMKNEDYVRMLLKLGYDVPKKLRPKHYVTPPLFKSKQKKRLS